MTESENAPVDAAKASRIARLFDIRLIVGGLLSLYGVIVLITGLVDLNPKKSSGMHLNIWTGIGMLVLGSIMLGWMRLRPLEPPKAEDLVETDPQESRAS